VKILENKNGYIFVIPDTSGQNISDGGYYDNTESFGGFFGDTKFFYSESGYLVGTDHKDENTHFVFR
jgi:esterase/lipase superfamily enzyme